MQVDDVCSEEDEDENEEEVEVLEADLEDSGLNANEEILEELNTLSRLADKLDKEFQANSSTKSPAQNCHGDIDKKQIMERRKSKPLSNTYDQYATPNQRKSPVI